jgi:hypothetical protein
MLATEDMEELSPNIPRDVAGLFLFCRWSFR